jgi:hypothetical protein
MRTEELENTSRVNLSSNSLFSKREGTEVRQARAHLGHIVRNESIVTQKPEVGKGVERRMSTMETGAAKARLEAEEVVVVNGGALDLAHVDPTPGKSSTVVEINNLYSSRNS